MSTGTGDGGVPVLDVVRLGARQEIGAGGQGTVYAVPAVRINHSWPVAYKEYRPHVLPALDGETLREMVSFVSTLPHADGVWLCDRAAWPAALVTRDGVLCGFLMRQIPGRFRISLPIGPHGSSHPAGVQYLLNSPGYLDRMCIPVTDRQRVHLLRHLASTLDRLHHAGVAVGDLSPKNLLFSQAPRPECFFIDCDTMRLRGRSALPQVETPGWQVPGRHTEPLATTASDRYKFALLAVRLFAGEQHGTDVARLAAVSADLAALAVCGLDPRPERRPAMSDWTAAFDLALDRPPADGPPADRPPADRPPADRPPADRPPADPPAADRWPAGGHSGRRSRVRASGARGRAAGSGAAPPVRPGGVRAGNGASAQRRPVGSGQPDHRAMVGAVVVMLIICLVIAILTLTNA